MTEVREKRRVRLGPPGDIPPGATRKFDFYVAGHRVGAFVVHYRGGFYAYLNRCRHIPMEMDWVENRFLTEDGLYILCATHGACYLPDTGECVSGPPFGKSLIRVPLVLEDGELVATYPENDDFFAET
ncbi:MAG: Rieske iron-sulfur protein [Candidatus Binatia bacterium]|nr:MAG: Rieske iron-sulfur protein [Candidatus Binatia bacterium]